MEKCLVMGCNNKPFNSRGICRGHWDRYRDTPEINLYPRSLNIRAKDNYDDMVTKGRAPWQRR